MRTHRQAVCVSWVPADQEHVFHTCIRNSYISLCMLYLFLTHTHKHRCTSAKIHTQNIHYALLRTGLDSQEASLPVVSLTSHSEAVMELHRDCRM